MPGKAGLLVSILERYGSDRSMLIPMLQDIQASAGYLPKSTLKQLSRELRIPLSEIYSVATFYSSFSLAPRGEHVITLCLGTVCYLKGADKIAARIKEELGIGEGETTADGRFTLLAMNCIGACALAPVMTVDDTYYQKVDSGQLPGILARYRAADEGGS
jgi:NADH:ubiquinone oxidoreductase subunit E